MKSNTEERPQNQVALIAGAIAVILCFITSPLVSLTYGHFLFHLSGFQLFLLITEILLFVTGLQLIITGKKSFLVGGGKHSLSRNKIRLLGFIQLTPFFFALLSLLSLRNIVAWEIASNTGWAPDLNSWANIILQNVGILFAIIVSIIVLRRNRDYRLFVLLAAFVLTILNLANARYSVKHDERYIEDGDIAYGYSIDEGIFSEPTITFWKSKWGDLDMKSTYKLNSILDNIDTSAWIQADQVIYLKLQLTIVDSASFPAMARILYDFHTGEIYVDSDALLWRNYLDGEQGWMDTAQFDKILESLGK